MHPNVFVLILSIFCWAVAASLVAEETNACCRNHNLCVVSELMELLISFLGARLFATAVNSSFPPVFRSFQVTPPLCEQNNHRIM